LASCYRIDPQAYAGLPLSQLLISFSNTRPRGLVLGRYDFGTDEFAWVDAPPGFEGATGLVACQEGVQIFVQCGTAPAGDSAVGFLAGDSRLTAATSLKLVRDVHSAIEHEGGLLVVSTGTDAVIRIDGHGEETRESVFWSASTANSDTLHVNSIARMGGEIFVSMFGPRPANGWEGARSGQVWNISRGEMVCEGLSHPHTLFEWDGRLCCLNSQTSQILQIGPGGATELFKLEGYLRGAAPGAGCLYVAASSYRRQSRSTGAMRVAAPAGSNAECLLFRLDSATGIVERRSLTCWAQEIYDLALLPEPLCRPFPPREKELYRRLALFDEQYRELLHTLNGTAARADAYDGELHRLINEDRNWPIAAFALERLLRRDPSNADWQYHYGVCMLQLGSPERATEHFEKALVLGYTEFWVRFHLASAHFAAGRLDAARQEYSRVIALRPEGVDISALGDWIESAVRKLHGSNDSARDGAPSPLELAMTRGR
jgi:tetratricopeptide (TPR) repeat protein